MKPTVFDRATKVLAVEKSRRHMILGLGAAALAGIPSIRSWGHKALGEAGATPSPTPRTRPTFPPIFVRPRLTFIVGPGTPTPTPEAFCGGDDTEDVEMYSGNLGVTQEFVAANQSAVGNLQWNSNLSLIFDDPGNVNGVRYCSGTLIAEDLFLTAGHCFTQFPTTCCWRVPRINGTDDPISRADIAANMTVAFNFQFDSQGIPRLERRVAVVALVEDQLDDLDYAVVQLAENPGPEFGPARVAAADAPVDSRICIIGHPDGRPKRIAAGKASQYQDNNLYYDDIDTDGGSSGASILLSPEGTIVGVHTNGGCDIPEIGNNHGLRISSLLRASPILRGLVAR